MERSRPTYLHLHLPHPLPLPLLQATSLAHPATAAACATTASMGRCAPYMRVECLLEHTCVHCPACQKPDMSTIPPRPSSALQLHGFVFSRVKLSCAAAAGPRVAAFLTPPHPISRPHFCFVLGKTAQIWHSHTPSTWSQRPPVPHPPLPYTHVCRYFRFLGNCVPCPAQHGTVIGYLVVVALLWVLINVAFARSVETLVIVINFCQFISIVVSFSLQWPATVGGWGQVTGAHGAQLTVLSLSYWICSRAWMWAACCKDRPAACPPVCPPLLPAAPLSSCAAARCTMTAVSVNGPHSHTSLYTCSTLTCRTAAVLYRSCTAL